MKLNSSLFDRIRVKPENDRSVRREAPPCEWNGCKNEGTHRAPKGRGHERDYWRFCLNHVRQYNQSYNFFAGMSADAVSDYQKDALTGHRPTWKMGMSNPSAARPDDEQSFVDPFGVFHGGKAKPKRKKAENARSDGRSIRNAERKAFDTLGLDIDASKPDIKSKFKDLVKRHHPDTNGGDRSTEDRLIEIIQAYNYLKSTGFC